MRLYILVVVLLAIPITCAAGAELEDSLRPVRTTEAANAVVAAVPNGVRSAVLSSRFEGQYFLDRGERMVLVFSFDRSQESDGGAFDVVKQEPTEPFKVSTVFHRTYALNTIGKSGFSGTAVHNLEGCALRMHFDSSFDERKP